MNNKAGKNVILFNELAFCLWLCSRNFCFTYKLRCLREKIARLLLTDGRFV
jgi:hypothetical protein